MADYIFEFKNLSVHTPGLTADNLLHCFVAGLKEEIHRELVLLNPKTLQMEMGMARLAEQKLQSTNATQPRPWYNQSSQNSHPSTPIHYTKHSQASSTSLPIRRLTVAEMTARHVALNPGTSEQQHLSEIEHPSISFNTLEGHFAASTLHILGRVNGHNLTVLIDSGSTHNFIQTKIAKRLQLLIKPSSHLNVTVGNGEALQYNSVCAKVALQMSDYTFEVDLFLLPIYGAKVVLGAYWMASIGPALFDYGCLIMSFQHHGFQITLHGKKHTRQLSQMSLGQLQRATHTNIIFSFYQLQAQLIDSALPQLNQSTNQIETDMSTSLHNDLATLLQ
ncbi:unnamed protein product [Rhodiola kirilowii]